MAQRNGSHAGGAEARRPQDDRPLVTGPSLGPIPYHWVAAIVVIVGTFLGVLDSTITNIALPTLGKTFDRPDEDVIWVALSFIVVSTGLSLTMGRLGDLYGRKMLYVLGFGLFTIALALSAISSNLEQLVGSRVLTAIGQSMTMANGAAIITAAFPPSKRGTGLGLIVSTVGAGAAAGPSLGGLLIELIDWRAIFWLRIPFGLVGALLAWRLLVDSPSEQRPKGLDIPGAVLLFGLLGFFTVAINRGEGLGWTSNAILAMFAAGLVCLLLFIRTERRAASPVVDLALFKGRGFSFGIMAAILQFTGASASLYLGSFLLINARGFSTIEAALMIMPMSIAMLVWSPFSGRLSDRLGSRPLTTAGMLMVCTALALLAMTDANTSPVDFGMRMLLLGIGMSTFSSPNTAVIMSAVPPERLGTASASQTTARTIGNSIGGATAIAIYAAVAASYATANGVSESSSAALISGYQSALWVAAAITVPAILFCLVGGQRGVRRVAGHAAAQVQVVRQALESELSLMVPLFRGQKSTLHGGNGRDRRNGVGAPPSASSSAGTARSGQARKDLS